jgi:hypothetical protein
VENEAEAVSASINTLRERKEKAQETYVKLKRSLETTDEALQRSQEEQKLREQEIVRVDRDVAKCVPPPVPPKQPGFGKPPRKQTQGSSKIGS